MSNRPKKTRSLVVDSNHRTVQAWNKFQCNGDSPAAYNSPFWYTTAIVGLTVPNEAYEMEFSSTQNMHISNDSTMACYDLVDIRASGIDKEVIPCADMDNIYIRGATVGGTLYFRYNLL